MLLKEDDGEEHQTTSVSLMPQNMAEEMSAQITSIKPCVELVKLNCC
jgi:hypothetical protein